METQVLIIGGGATGTGLARDLALRGVDCVLAERNWLAAGASGANHGLLHSGARYAAQDPVSAAECRREAELLKRLAPQCVEETGGLFIALPGDDDSYIADFPGRCADVGIEARELFPARAIELEPGLNPDITAAFAVADATIDPFRLARENAGHARDLGAEIKVRHRLTELKTADGRIHSAVLEQADTGVRLRVEPQVIINAAGAWSGQVAALAGLDQRLVFSKGTLVIAAHRLSGRVINRLRPPGDGDILVPGGTVSILGTTSVRLETPDDIRPTVDEVNQIIGYGAKVMPVVKGTRFIRAYAGVRPLIDATGFGRDDRDVSRGFEVFDHQADGVANFITITGGKLTTFRLMAEKAADLACAKLGLDAPCRTATVPLPARPSCRWTVPDEGPRQACRPDGRDDPTICECEMVSQGTVDSILTDLSDRDLTVDLRNVGLRSRLGKGSCQGGSCAVRLTAQLYDQGDFTGPAGLTAMADFLNERWRGLRPVLFGVQLGQAELQEAIHSGLFGLDRAIDQDRTTEAAL